MSEMVEHVARAMYAAAAELAPDDYPGWDADLYFRREAFVSHARAAIAAMREFWGNMIDAALKD